MSPESTPTLTVLCYVLRTNMSLPPAPKKNYYHIHALDIPNAQRAKHNAGHLEITLPLVESGYIGAFPAIPLPCHSPSIRL